MEANKKLRGQKHHQNKSRYQNKAKVISKIVSAKGIAPTRSDSPKEAKGEPKTEGSLQNNWHRYQELSDDEQIDESTNFSLLAQAPISHGGHFQFKSDKNVESQFDFENLRKNKMFSMDLHQLKSRLSTIAFHERCGLDESYFTESQMEEMNKRALQNKAQYESYLKISSITKDFLTKSVSGCENRKSVEQSSSGKEDSDLELSLTTETQIDSDSKENDDISKVSTQDPTIEAKTTNVSHKEVQNKVQEDKEELEEWLDDILND